MKLILLFILLTFFAPQVVRADTISELVPVIIQAESSGNPMASDGRSYGLMGISECVLKDYIKSNVKRSIPQGDFSKRVGTIEYSNWKAVFIEQNIQSLFVPELNIEIGTWYLRKLQSQLPEKYKNSRAHLVSAYNNGLGWLKKHNWQPPRSHKNKVYNSIYKEYWKTP